jgi:hypothetical protein
MSVLSRGLGRTPLSDNALEQKSYSTDAQAVKTIVARTPATQLLTLNSQDRLQYNVGFNSASGDNRVLRQAWNKFRLQRPQPLMGAFATRLAVAEVRFPYFLPNVNTNNNKIWLGLADVLDQLSIYELTLYPSFFSGTGLADALNSIITGMATFGTYQVIAGPNVPINPAGYPIFSFNENTQQMLFTPNPTIGAFLYGYNPVSSSLNPIQYYNSPSLALLMNFDIVQVSSQVDNTVPITANPTDLSYTDYIDIVSDKLNQYASSRDGSSDNNFNRSLICRLYVEDDISLKQGQGQGQQQAPFIIHRQFQNPKMIEWNKEASIDWVDISIYDMYGNLFPLPTLTFPGGVPAQVGVYPDFQITLLATQE